MTRKAFGSMSSAAGEGGVSETTVRPETGPWGLIIQSEDRTSYFPRDGRKPPRVERRLPSGAVLVDDFAAGLVLREDYVRRVDTSTRMPKGKALGDRAVMALQQAGAGGEPLAQKACIELLDRLCDAGFDVSLETSGALDIRGVNHRVSRIVDSKTPGSGESGRNLLENLEDLTPHDELKFVLVDEADYQWAKSMLAEHRLAERCPVVFSPAAGDLSARTLAEWILRDGLPVRMQIQLH